MLQFLREWRIDRMTDRIARKPSGRQARETYGVDHSPEMVSLAAPDAVLGNAAALPFPDARFTAVSSIVAFFFFPDPVQALREMRRVLDPASGRLAIFTTAPEAKDSPAAPYPLATRGHFYTDDELVALGRDAGLREPRIAFREPWAQLLTARA
jgi:ubiquinone/menaquinone biosynthesis C-methylase UbiE